MKKLFSLFVLLFFLACAGLAGRTWAAAADDKAVADFYRGKTVKIVVGFSAGGGYDAYSRVIGRHIQKHIPGNPSVIVENMAGAGSILLANHMFNVAPKDGTVIGNFSGQIILRAAVWQSRGAVRSGEVSFSRRADRRDLFADGDEQIRRHEV